MGVSNSELFEHFERKEKECRRQFTLLRDQALTILRRKKKPGWETKVEGLVREALWELRYAEKWKREAATFRQFCTPTTAPLREYIIPKEGCIPVIRTTIEWGAGWGASEYYTVPVGRTRKQSVGR